MRAWGHACPWEQAGRRGAEEWAASLARSQRLHFPVVVGSSASEPAGTRKQGGAAAAARPGHAEQLLEKVWDENGDPFTKAVTVTTG